jgi:hypothetical protein
VHGADGRVRLLGGSRALSVSTTSTIAVLVATSLAALSPRSADDVLRDAFTLTALVGGVPARHAGVSASARWWRTSARPP